VRIALQARIVGADACRRATDKVLDENIRTIVCVTRNEVTGMAIERHIVGVSSTAGDGLHPFLYTEATGMLDLWSLVINLPAGFVTRDVRYELSINDFPGHKFGQICGSTLMDEPFILTPDR